jgi:hypothetical protein
VEDVYANPSGQFFQIIGETPINFPGPIIANSPFDVGVKPGSIPAGQGFAAIPQFYHPVSNAQSATFNVATLPSSTLDTARTNFLASASHQIFGKQLELFGNFLYSNADYRSNLNAQPLNTGSSVLILGSVRVDPDTGAFVPETRGPPAPFNPFQETIDANSNLLVTNRYNATNPRIFDNENNFYRFLGGIRS